METIRHNSSFRIIWDLLILILIFVSCTIIPFQVAFQHVVSISGTMILVLIDLLFFTDIFLNFFTSYRHQGSVITDKKKMASHYLRTLFALDIVANIPLDIILLGIRGVSISSVSVVLLFRTFRLLRIVRLFVIFRRWEDLSWTNSGYLRITKFLSFVMILVHWIACAWFLVAFIGHFPADCWVVREGVENAAPNTQYIRSLYWAITTMTTVGYGDITPKRNIEYVFTSIMMLIGASLYAYIIGNIASILSNLDSAKATFWNKIEAANQYLRSRQVPHELNTRVRDYYDYIWARRRGVREDSFFDDLPDPLRLDILLNLTRELLERVPLFKYCSPTLRNTLLMTLKAQTYAPDGYIVREGELGKEIYFISRGEVEITSGEGQEVHDTFEAGDYFGDLSLLLGEKRTASVRTLTYCDIFILTKDDFDRIRNEYPEFREVIKKMSSERTEKTAELFLKGVIL
ncbi:ion transporter [Candidatus Poribacteria bacterium]